MKSHCDLDAWKKAMDLARQVYAVTRAFPADERFGLTNQVRRAVVSVPSNIAEGAARGSPADFVRFLRIALGSLAEVETQVLLASELGYLADVHALLALVGEVRNLTLGLIRHLGTRPGASRVSEESAEYVLGDE
jgi:four helix bundle protein